MAKKRQEAPVRGAKVSGISGGQMFNAWLAHHKSSCKDSLQRLLATPLQSLLTWLVIAIALALPAALYQGLKNVQQLGQGWQDSAQMSVFLHKDAKDRAIEQLVKQLKEDSAIERVDLVTPTNALAEFQRYSGLGNILDDLDENPLPTVLVIQPSEGVRDPDSLEALQTQISASPVVDNVQLDMGWLRRLYEMIELGERIIFALGSLLAIGVLLIVGNTLKLAIENRRDEIVVTKLVGGTNGFVRRPFLYTGLWYGIGGGLIALLLLLILGFWLSGSVDRLVLLYDSEYSLTGLSFTAILALLLGASGLGWVGAWLAVSRHLKAIEPS